MLKEQAMNYVSDLVNRAKTAQAIAETYSQARVDELCEAIVYNATREDFAQKLAEYAVEESGMGIVAHKYGKIMVKSKGALRDMKGKLSVGVVDVNEDKGMIKLAKPMGVIAALAPCTNPEATPIVKATSAVKTRNAIIIAPHPRTRKTNQLVIENIRETLRKYDAPEDLVIAIDPESVSIDVSNELMNQADFILATGGSGMVKAAYSSGTPAIGVGAGNAVTIVDGTTDLSKTANDIMRSKTFDHATSCSAENSCIAQRDVYEKLVMNLEMQGGYIIRDNSKEKEKLQNTMWHDGHLNKDIVAQSAQKIADMAGLNISESTKFFVVEEHGIGKAHPFSGEKLSVVMTLYKYNAFPEALDTLNEIMEYQGLGHSCGIHTDNEGRVLSLAKSAKASRIMVNQPQCLANSGSWTNGMPMTMSLGCSTWGGNSVSHNVNWEDLLNYTYVSSPIASTEPTDNELFSQEVIQANS